MRLLIDFTSTMSGNTGGRNYPLYVLPAWQRLHPADHLVPIFARGQTPEQLRSLEGVVEVGRKGRPPALRRLVDLHVAAPREMSRQRVDVAYFPGNVVPVRTPRETPLVVAIRATVAFHYKGQFSAARAAYLKWATYHAVRAANRIIVPTSATADDLMRFVGAHRRKIVVIPHGIDLDEFSLPATRPVEPGLFLFVSRPFDYKGIETTFRSVKAFADRRSDLSSRLLIADGGIPEREKKALLGVARGIGAGDLIEFLGAVPHNELAILYRRASALVLPTAYESFGNTYLEAAASGCPIITGGGHGIDETIGPVAIFVPPHSHQSIAEAMSQVSDLTEKERAEQGRSLRRWAERFSWDQTVRETRGVLSELV